MTPAARSLQVFGIYLLGTSAVLLFAPNVLLGLLGIPVAQDVWILRVLGVVVAVIGVYDLIFAARAVKPAYLPSVLLRVFVFVVFVALALLGLAPPQLILFGVIDLLGALWTWTAMRREAGA
jgi:uncharacterized membrane protein